MLIDRPELELVGVLVHSADKVGLDAGDLCDRPSTGITATDDVDALLALTPDCIVYTATADLRPKQAVDDLVRILEAGIDVVSTSVVALVYPAAANPRDVERLEAACAAGNASCFTSGIDPGYANDLLPLALLGCQERVDSVRIAEILNYEHYDQPEVVFDTFGFAKPLAETPMLLLPGVLTFAWGPVVHALADALGAPLDEIREDSERVAVDHDLESALGPIPAGTAAGLRFELQGIVAGEPRIFIEHVTRMHDSVAPDWPQPLGPGGYHLVIEGLPRTECHLLISDPATGQHGIAGLMSTAARVVNVIPQVCAADPGLLTAADLPLGTPPRLAAS